MGSLSKSSAGKERTTKVSCEKTSRRLRYLIARAKRLGLTMEEIAKLPAIKKLLSRRVTSTTKILFMIVLILGTCFVLAYLYDPCIIGSRT